MSTNGKGPGTVYIVGAGPGDSGLITVRGVEALQRAGVVVYDYLANPELLDICPPACERIYVGKMAGRHSLPQEEINALLAERALEGKTVVRLKGGDPFIFGRGGEEALELVRNGVPFIVVPGVTAAISAAAYAGIPLTHRGMAASAVLVTGHEDPSKAEADVDWERLAAGGGTIAVYMGVKNLPVIAEGLRRGGLAGDTPAALIRWGTLNLQQTLTGTLADIAAKAEEHGFGPPAILLVGEVVRLREQLRWFDVRPLFGRTIVVTRSRSQASDLVRGLRELGAEVREFPSIDIQPLQDLRELDGALHEIRSFAWIVFTSVNGVEVFFRVLEQAGLDARALFGVRVAAIGPETASRLKQHGVRPDLVPARFTSEAVLQAFSGMASDFRGQRFLFPGSEIARDLLPEGLEKMGARTVRVPVYRNVVPRHSPEEVDEIFAEGLDLVTFTSSSTVTHLVEILRTAGREHYLERIRSACIGPVTAETAREHGIEVALESSPHTIAALIRAIENHFGSEAKR